MAWTVDGNRADPIYAADWGDSWPHPLVICALWSGIELLSWEEHPSPSAEPEANLDSPLLLCHNACVLNR
jgi:hypothetical protein